jgi:hypothetical protein
MRSQSRRPRGRQSIPLPFVFSFDEPEVPVVEAVQIATNLTYDTEPSRPGSRSESRDAGPVC